MAAEPAILDSGAWIEWLTASAGAVHYDAIVKTPDSIIVPAIVIFEVSRWLIARTGIDKAHIAIAVLQRSTVIDLDAELALNAALLAVEHRLTMADSMIYATAQRFNAVLWTQDADFESLPGVRYFAKT